MHPDLLGQMVTLEHHAAIRKAAVRMALAGDVDSDGEVFGSPDSPRVGRLARLLAFRSNRETARLGRLSTGAV